MCEVWKWIMIVTAVPVVLVFLSDVPFLWSGRGQWAIGGARWQAWLGWVHRHLRLYWFAVGVLVLATTVYAAHCR
jgi:hypothetical protein